MSMRTFLVGGAIFLGGGGLVAWRVLSGEHVVPAISRADAAQSAPAHGGPLPRDSKGRLVHRPEVPPSATFAINPGKPSESLVYVQARQRVQAKWDDFLARAHPTVDQQRAILSALYDAQLYAAEVSKMQDDWLRETHGEDLKPESFPHVERSQDIREAVNASVRDALTPEQYAAYEKTMQPVIFLAAMSNFVTAQPGK